MRRSPPTVQRLHWEGHPGTVVATSKTFKQLARFAGRSDPAAASRLLHRQDVRAWIPRLAEMTPDQRAVLPGVRPARARQLLAGAVVAAVTMKALGIETVQICPWALREGILLRRLAPRPTADALRQVRLIESISAGVGVGAGEGSGVSDLDEYRQARRTN